MKSSWAGAMGLTQFLPSDYLKYAVDFDGDGYADIWNSVPDALASAAKQLRRRRLAARPALGLRSASAGRCRLHHRRAGQYACRSATGSSAVSCRPMAAFFGGRARRAGLAGAAGRALRAVVSRHRKLFRHQGIQFFRPLRAVRRPLERPHRRSAAASRRRGARWRSCRPPISTRMQQILTARGLYHDKIDGKAGMLTRAALGEYQKKNGLKIDCWPTAAVLGKMEGPRRN